MSLISGRGTESSGTVRNVDHGETLVEGNEKEGECVEFRVTGDIIRI